MTDVDWILVPAGAVLVDDYLRQARRDAARTTPSPEFDAAFRELIEKARVLAEAPVRLLAGRR